MDEIKVEIPISRLTELLKTEAKLRLLEIGGVDNRAWYGESLNQEGELSLDDIEEEIDEDMAEIIKKPPPPKKIIKEDIELPNKKN